MSRARDTGQGTNHSGGTLSSNIIMPTGMIVKVTKHNLSDYSVSTPHYDNNKSNFRVISDGSNNVSWQVTTKQQYSDILIIGSYHSGGHGGSHEYFDMKYGSISSTDTEANGNWLSGTNYDGMTSKHPNTTHDKEISSIVWLHTAGYNANTTIYYAPYVGQWNNTETIHINRYDSSDTNGTNLTHFLFIEIAK